MGFRDPRDRAAAPRPRRLSIAHTTRRRRPDLRSSQGSTRHERVPHRPRVGAHLRRMVGANDRTSPASNAPARHPHPSPRRTAAAHSKPARDRGRPHLPRDDEGTRCAARATVDDLGGGLAPRAGAETGSDGGPRWLLRIRITLVLALILAFGAVVTPRPHRPLQPVPVERRGAEPRVARGGRRLGRHDCHRHCCLRDVLKVGEAAAAALLVFGSEIRSFTRRRHGPSRWRSE